MKKLLVVLKWCVLHLNGMKFRRIGCWVATVRFLVSLLGALETPMFIKNLSHLGLGPRNAARLMQMIEHHFDVRLVASVSVTPQRPHLLQADIPRFECVGALRYACRRRHYPRTRRNL